MDDKNETKKEIKLFKNWSFLKKIKQVKHIGLIITVLFVLILLIILFGDFNFSFLSPSGSTNSGSITANATYTNNSEFVKMLENKLKLLLEKIEGAGNVEVMVSAEGGQVVVASDDETTTTKNSKGDETTTVSASPIIIQQNGTSSPLVLGEIYPTIKGVVVVSSGAKNVNVKMNIMTVIQTLFGLDDSKIVILVGR